MLPALAASQHIHNSIDVPQMQTQTQAGVEVINQDGQLFVSGADEWREVVVATKADLADWGDYVSDLALQGSGMRMRVWRDVDAGR